MNETRQNQNIQDEASAQAARPPGERASELARSGQVEGEESQGARPPGGPGGIEGEGSYSGARAYDRGAREFVRSGRVAEAAAEAEEALDRDPEAHLAAEAQGKARIQEEDPLLASQSPEGGDSTAVHVRHERQGWVVEAQGTLPAPIFDNIDDALRRAHEIASRLHVPLFVHGPDGELIDTFEA